MKRLFDKYIAVDWSAKNSPSPAKPSKDSIWVGEKDLIENTQKETYIRTRHECLNYLKTILTKSISSKKRVIIGYDLDFGFPSGFVDALSLTGIAPKWKIIWNKLAELIIDDEYNVNNRFEVASYLNSLCLEKNPIETGPLWGHPIKQKFLSLHYKSPKYPFVTRTGINLRKFRWTEMREAKAQPVWKLIGTASVGGQTLVGIPAVFKLRNEIILSQYSKIWPFETGFSSPSAQLGDPLILHVEIWPGILSKRLNPMIRIKDQAQVRATVDWISECDTSGELISLLNKPENLSEEQEIDCIEEEGWVLGSGYSKKLHANNSLF